MLILTPESDAGARTSKGSSLGAETAERCVERRSESCCATSHSACGFRFILFLIFNFEFWGLGFGFWVLGVGLRFGFWVLGFGFWVLDSEFWVLGFEFWVLGFGF